MAIRILPVTLEYSPEISQLELEGLIVEVNPRIEDKEQLVDLRVSELRSAVEQFLIAYRQSVYFSEHVNDFSPAQQMEIIENIHTYQVQANKFAAKRKDVKAAFSLFIANMDIEGNTSQSIH